MINSTIRKGLNVKIRAEQMTKFVPWIALLPALLFLLLITMYPFIYTVFISTFNWYLPTTKSFVGIKNYIDVLTDTEFLEALWRTIYFTVGCLLLEHFLGLFLAILLYSIKKLRAILTSAFMLPMMVPPVVSALIWKLMFRPNTGVLNYFLRLLNISPQLWVHGKYSVIPSIILVDLWQWTPFVTLILLGGLNSISNDLYEAADIDGAGFRDLLFKIIIPLLKPFFMVTILLRYIYVFTTFDIIMSLTAGGPGRESATIYFMGYLNSFEYLQMGRGATWNVIVFIGTFIVCSFLINKIFRRDQI